ncbi:uncharacterized protein L201_005549 [Kwoniella dendrophila CBS 6074]|uniref:WW domain-containing protein n=1 Tax=Kwoniella dendrophila CBS 6074 TaxID=1295534 RepID=A0AAX4K1J7_9TREE
MSPSTSKKATVEDAGSSSGAPTPPPIASNLPETSSKNEKGVVDQPITSLGQDEANQGEEEGVENDNEDEEEAEEWDPSEERLPGQTSSNPKDKGKAKDNEEEKEKQPWQAIWAPEQNAWYFWNTKTGEVSWTNPLDPSDASGSIKQQQQPPLPNEQPPLPSTSTSAYSQTNLGYGFGNHSNLNPGEPEIDEGLEYLFGGGGGSNGGGSSNDPTLQKASFNARTGQFTSFNQNQRPEYLNEYNRSKRMNNYYFDVDEWEKQTQLENEKKRKLQESGVNPNEKKITKKDMERFKKKNAEKRARNQAWLRE